MSTATSCGDELTQDVGEAVRFVKVREVTGPFEQFDPASWDRALRSDRVPRWNHPVTGSPDNQRRDRQDVGQVVVGADGLAPWVDDRSGGGEERATAFTVAKRRESLPNGSEVIAGLPPNA
jgi:hypothetical protein